MNASRSQTFDYICDYTYPLLAFSDLTCHLGDTGILFFGCTVPPESSCNQDTISSGGIPWAIIQVVWIFPRSLSIICYGRWVRSELTAYIFSFYMFFDSMKWWYYQRHMNNFESHNFLKLWFSNTEGLH